MALSSFSLLAGGTNSATGGSSVTYANDGKQIAGGVHVADGSVSDLRLRPNITFKLREPKYDNTLKKFTSKEKKSVVLVKPKLKADGTIAFNLIRIEREIDAETTAAEAAELNIQGGQLTFDSEVSPFWVSGNLT